VGRPALPGLRRAPFPLVAVLALVACGGDGATGPPAGFVPGTSYFGTSHYVEYIAGDLPVIVTAPHGGSLRPTEMPDRTSPDTLRDTNTEELVRAIDTAFAAATGHHPHIVMCLVHRVKLDCNRELAAAAMGDPEAAQAWAEFQAFIDSAKAAVVRAYGGGLYVDVHGHGHAIQRLELGYLLTGSELGFADSVLDGASWLDAVSVRHLAAQPGRRLSAVLRGPSSLGDLFAARGYAAVPSGADPAPGGAPYFSGGYNTGRHGSLTSGTISGVQIEANYTRLRDTPVSRATFAGALVGVVRTYLVTWLGLVT
jgi:hypothetical protein